jgi:hypothetical protein
MDKLEILNTIKKAAADNGGKCPTLRNFIQTTGIKERMWLGKYWARWSDAVKEAGVTPSHIIISYDASYLLQKITELILEIKKFPTGPEISLKRNSDKTYPSDNCFFYSFGGKRLLIKEILRYCNDKPELRQVSGICLAEYNRLYQPKEKKAEVFFVYILSKSEKYQLVISDKFIIPDEFPKKLPGCSCYRQFQSRETEIIIATWQNDFADKQDGNNWYKLTREDLKLFERKIKKVVITKL